MYITYFNENKPWVSYNPAWITVRVWVYPCSTLDYLSLVDKTASHSAHKSALRHIFWIKQYIYFNHWELTEQYAVHMIALNNRVE